MPCAFTRITARRDTYRKRFMYNLATFEIVKMYFYFLEIAEMPLNRCTLHMKLMNLLKLIVQLYCLL